MREDAPEHNCDIVMKGGITSGVVYPLAIVELADEFRFRNIGGTSAGAIAAAVTAAAEYRRVTAKTADGFRRLAELPAFLAGKTGKEPNLLSLFPPTKETRALFALAVAFVGRRAFALKTLLGMLRLLFVSPLLTFVAFLPAIIVIVVLFREAPQVSGLASAGLAAVALLLLAAGLVLLAVIAVIRALCFTIPGNGFGFSTGRAPEGSKLPGVVEWLDHELQSAAGRNANDPPLTFGDLWTADGGASVEACREDPALRSINLQMITTALTHGRPYRLPFETRLFAFRATEFERIFPRRVVEHLKTKGQLIVNDLYLLPPAEEMPIVVATRMSLSFPILFTLVPLYAVDYTKPEAERSYERCWFIDGGLCSNFPLNLFDSPFPRWPTFGINLGSPSAGRKIEDDEELNVWMVSSNAAGRAARWMRFPATGVAALAGYVGAALDTIRNWRDNTQMATPGFLDRVVHINLGSGEGGLNLEMDQRRVDRLVARGAIAGRRLRARFGAAGATADPPNWNSHRWSRYKIAMALLQKALRNMDNAFTTAGYQALVDRAQDANPKTGYWWESRRTDYQALSDAFVAFAAKIRSAPVDFGDESPRPKPELRITPRL